MKTKLRYAFLLCAAFSFILLLVVIMNYISNERMIHQFEEGHPVFNAFGSLGVLEPYIAPYNEGNVYFEKKLYEKAIVCYEKALLKSPKKPYDCRIRINLALAMTLPIQPEEVNDSNRKEIIQILDSAIEVLCEHSCADKIDTKGNEISGHSKQATELKEDIERLKEELLKVETPETEEKSETEEPTETEEQTRTEDTITEQLKGLQERGQNERGGSESLPYMGDFEPYLGKSW